MPGIVVLGTQWGDEGKGKIIDMFAGCADAVVRFAGGNNAGHTVKSDGVTVVANLLPSGFKREGVGLVLGNGMVIDPRWLLREIRTVQQQGFLKDSRRLLVSDLAHVTMPYHREIEKLREKQRFGVGSTRNGIGPTYEAKIGRRGIRIRDLLDPERLQEKIAQNIEALGPYVKSQGGEFSPTSEIVKEYSEYGERLKPHVADTSRWVHEQLKEGRKVIFEGAQGALLDIDHGTYPYVTSSSTIAGSACTGAGIGPTSISGVIGIVKAYTSRASQKGPMPTRLPEAEEDVLRRAGDEYLPNWARHPHRCGWLDVAALRKSARLNGLSGIALTKVDVLACFKRIKICVGYENDGVVRDEMPRDDELSQWKPVYEELESWSDVSEARDFDSLPKSLRQYVSRIEELVGVPVRTVSVGPDRAQTIGLMNPFTES